MSNASLQCWIFVDDDSGRPPSRHVQRLASQRRAASVAVVKVKDPKRIAMATVEHGVLLLLISHHHLGFIVHGCVDLAK